MHNFSEINHIYSQDVQTPLGQIRVSGILIDGEGIPLQPMRVLGSYALVYLFEGAGRYHDGNGYSHKMRVGDALLLFPELPHSYGPGPGETWSEFYTMFDGPFFDLMREVGVLDATKPVRHLVGEWLSRLTEAVTAVRFAAPAERTVEISRFVALLTELSAADVPEIQERGPENWLALARFLLEVDLTAEIDMEQVARRTGVSYESFRKRFQHQSGISPAHYRMNRRIEVASDLLRNTSMTNRQVAESVGFADENSFYKRFKQVVGKTPRAYRGSSAT